MKRVTEASVILLISPFLAISYSFLLVSNHANCYHEDNIFTMGRSYTNIIIHLIFHIKDTACLMKEDDLPQIFAYMGGIIRGVSGFAYTIGGRPDHIHILTTLPLTMTLPDFVRTIKAGSSKWIKQLSSDYRNFAWQEGYAAFSVSESIKHNVIDYISNQKLHHQRCSAYSEFIHFLEKNGISTDYVPHRM